MTSSAADQPRRSGPFSRLVRCWLSTANSRPSSSRSFRRFTRSSSCAPSAKTNSAAARDARIPKFTTRTHSATPNTKAISVCRKQRSESAVILDAASRATAACAPIMLARILAAFTIANADRLRAAATADGMRSGASSFCIAIRSARSRASAKDWRRAPLPITSPRFALAAIGAWRTDKARASAATTGSDLSSHVPPATPLGRGVFFFGDRAPADPRGVAHTHPRNKISRFN